MYSSCRLCGHTEVACHHCYKEKEMVLRARVAELEGAITSALAACREIERQQDEGPVPILRAALSYGSLEMPKDSECPCCGEKKR